MRTLLNCKNGQLKNILVIVLILLVFGLIILFARLFFDYSVVAYNSAGLLSNPASAAAVDAFTVAFNLWDYLVVFLVMALIVGFGITTYRLATSRVFFIVMWVVAPILGLISYLFNYAFYQVASLSVFSSVVGSYPMTVLLCTNLHWVSLLAVVVGSLTLYVKRDVGQYVVGEK